MTEGTNAAPSAALDIAELALRLHEKNGTELRIDLPAGSTAAMDGLPGDWKLVNGAIEFNSLTARNDIVAKAAFEDLRYSSGIDPGPLFDRAYELWRDEIGHSDQSSGRLLALASESLDVFAIGAQRIRDGARVFDVLHLLEAALPYLGELQVPSIIDLVVAKSEPIKNDLAGGAIHGALEAWLGKRPNKALELHAGALDNLSEATASLLGNAAVALSKADYAAAVELARKDAKSGTPMRAQSGAWTLGRLLLDDRAPPASIDVVVAAVVDLIESEQSDLRSQAIRAAAGAMHVMSAFDPVLQRLAEEGDQAVLCAAATTMFLKGKEIRERGVAQRWLELLTALQPEFKGAVRDLDHAMSRLLSDPTNASMVVSTLGQWVAKHGQRVPIDSDTAELFDDTARKLSTLEECWSSLLTDWLLSEKQEHAAALAGILSQLGHREHTELKLDISRLDELPTNDLMFLARRMLGYVHDRAQLTSLALSMLQSKDAEKRIYPVLRALLVDEIGYDYPGSTVDACRKAAEAATPANDKEFLVNVADAIEKTAGALGALPSLSELRPPTKLRRLFARARAKQMGESFEEASRNSIWRQIATQITIKAGRSTFSYQDSNYGQSMKLSSMSHSIELPRREAFDPIGNSIRHLGFRLAKRNEP